MTDEQKKHPDVPLSTPMTSMLVDDHPVSVVPKTSLTDCYVDQ
jgi:hypothetical protein